MKVYTQKAFDLNDIRNMNKFVTKDLSSMIGQGNSNECPQFGYPMISYSPPDFMKQVSYDETTGFDGKKKVQMKKQKYIVSNKVHIDSQWEPLTKQILQSAHKGKKLNIATSMESHENHNLILDEVMRTFTKSSKLTL